MNISATCDDQCPGVGINGGKSAEMLSDLLQVLETLVLSPHDGRHPAQGRPLQLLAPVQGVTELEQPHVVLGHVVDQVSGSVNLTQGQFVMVLTIRKNEFCVSFLPRKLTLSYRTFIRSA